MSKIDWSFNWKLQDSVCSLGKGVAGSVGQEPSSNVHMDVCRAAGGGGTKEMVAYSSSQRNILKNEKFCV